MFGMSIPIPKAVVTITTLKGDKSDVKAFIIMHGSVQLWNISTSRFSQVVGDPDEYVTLFKELFERSDKAWGNPTDVLELLTAMG